MTLGNIRTRVARVSGMSESAAADLALIDAWANEAVIQFLKETKIDIRSASLAVTVGSGDYTLDSDILAFDSVWLEPASGDQSVLMEQASVADIIKMRLLESSGVSPIYYALKGAHLLMLHPEPTAADNLHILYVPRPASSLTATGDTPSDSGYGNIPDEFHPVLEAYVKWKACEAEEHKPSDNGLKFQSEWEIGLAKTRAAMARKNGPMATPIRVGMPRRVVPITPGTDLR